MAARNLVLGEGRLFFEMGNMRPIGIEVDLAIEVIVR
jgi:hypothetical protein